MNSFYSNLLSFQTLFQDLNPSTRVQLDITLKEALNVWSSISENSKKQTLELSHPSIIGSIASTLTYYVLSKKEKMLCKTQKSKSGKFSFINYLDFSAINCLPTHPKTFSKIILNSDLDIKKGYKKDDLHYDGSLYIPDEKEFGLEVIQNFSKFLQSEEGLFQYCALSQVDSHVTYEKLRAKIEQQLTQEDSNDQQPLKLLSHYYALTIIFINQFAQAVGIAANPFHQSRVSSEGQKSSSQTKNSTSTEAETEYDHLSIQSDFGPLNLTIESDSASTIVTPRKKSGENGLSMLERNGSEKDSFPELPEESTKKNEIKETEVYDGVYLGDLQLNFYSDFLVNEDEVDEQTKATMEELYGNQNNAMMMNQFNNFSHNYYGPTDSYNSGYAQQSDFNAGGMGNNYYYSNSNGYNHGYDNNNSGFVNNSYNQQQSNGNYYYNKPRPYYKKPYYNNYNNSYGYQKRNWYPNNNGGGYNRNYSNYNRNYQQSYNNFGSDANALNNYEENNDNQGDYDYQDDNNNYDCQNTYNDEINFNNEEQQQENNVY